MTKTLFCVYQSFSRTFPANFLSSAHRTLGLSPSDHPGTLDFLLKKGHSTACRLILTFHFKLTHKPFRIFTARLFSHLIRRARCFTVKSFRPLSYPGAFWAIESFMVGSVVMGGDGLLLACCTLVSVQRKTFPVHHFI